MTRAERRHHEQRVYERRCARYPFYVQKHPGKTPGKVCSCEGCGNPRKWYGEDRPSDRRRQQDDGHDSGADSAFYEETRRDPEDVCDDPACPCHGETAIDVMAAMRPLIERALAARLG